VKLNKIQTFKRRDGKVAKRRASEKQEKADLSCMKIETTIQETDYSFFK